MITCEGCLDLPYYPLFSPLSLLTLWPKIKKKIHAHNQLMYVLSFSPSFHLFHPGVRLGLLYDISP